jgi:CTP synthase
LKIIFVTGGILSGIGKGIAAASIGALLRASGKQVYCQKFDGYLNVDPGTMNPTQHGEVFVTADGAETDLDIGHYERFLDTDMNRFSSFTSGKLYEELIARERRGDFLGWTVQIVPHLTDLVQEKIKAGYETADADISIIEIGGTVGDMENEYLLESARQLQHRLGRENVIFVHVVLLPYLGASKEFKSKPIQHSVRTLMGYGISPDFLVVRSDEVVPEEMLAKIASTGGLGRDDIIAAPTLDSIYKVPTSFASQGVSTKILQKLRLDPVTPDMTKWDQLVGSIDNSTDIITIGMVGKYVDLEDAYYSLNEWLKCAGFAHGKKVKLRFIDAEEVEKEWKVQSTKYKEWTIDTLKLWTWNFELFEGLDGICIPGGFGTRGTEGMITTAKYARENKIPYLGICLGSQIMAIEYARNVLGISDASSEEFAPDGKHNIIHIMEHQKWLTNKWGNMRLGSYECMIKKWSLAEKVYGWLSVIERHRHRFEFDPVYRESMEKAGFIVSATSPDGTLAEIVEIGDHPYMIATQAHPELISRPSRPHPLFMGLLKAIIENR